MANNMMPNTFLMIAIPPLPKKFSNRCKFLRTIYTMMTLMMIATIIDTILYSALIDNKVVSVPVPAIKGNAKGTTEAVFGMVSFEI